MMVVSFCAMWVFRRLKRTPDLITPVDTPLEGIETPQEPLPMDEVIFLWYVVVLITQYDRKLEYPEKTYDFL
jgi:hypothetical protein